MHDHKRTPQTDDSAPIVRCVVAGNFSERLSQLEETVAHNARTRNDEARRKTLQRERDLADGWRQHNVKAPNNQAARSLISRVASEIASNRKLDAVAAALDEPELVLIAQQYKRLLGLVIAGGVLDDTGDAEAMLKRAHCLVLSRLTDLHPLIEREFNRQIDESQDAPSFPSPL